MEKLIMADMNIKDARAGMVGGNSPKANSKQDAELGPGLVEVGTPARSYKVGRVTPSPTNIESHKERESK